MKFERYHIELAYSQNVKDFSSWDLGGVDLEGANLGGADLKGANLGGRGLERKISAH